MSIQFLDPLCNGNPVVACNVFDDCAEPIPGERPDPRLVFLARAAARFELVEAGELSLTEAFNGLMSSLVVDTVRL
jgi:hypothetical protein